MKLLPLLLLPLFANAQSRGREVVKMEYIEIKKIEGFFWAGTAMNFIAGSDSSYPLTDLYPGWDKAEDSTVIFIYSIKQKKTPVAKIVVWDGRAELDFRCRILPQYFDLCRDAFPKSSVIKNKKGFFIRLSK